MLQTLLLKNHTAQVFLSLQLSHSANKVSLKSRADLKSINNLNKKHLRPKSLIGIITSHSGEVNEGEKMNVLQCYFLFAYRASSYE